MLRDIYVIKNNIIDVSFSILCHSERSEESRILHSKMRFLVPRNDKTRSLYFFIKYWFIETK